MRLLVTGGSGFIGTHVIEFYSTQGIDLLNVDVKSPLKSEQTPFWRQGNILDREDLLSIFGEFQPTHVIHLAARTDVYGKKLADYEVNTIGTTNVLTAVENTPSVEHIIVTSTQFVHRPGYTPDYDENYRPHTVYGESKVATEKLTKASSVKCKWTIIRPTNIWGPWHPRYPYEFWSVLSRGLYIHPGNASPIRSYGYVENLVYQVDAIFRQPAQLINQKIFFLGDHPIHLLEWVNGFSWALAGREVRVAPVAVVRSLAYFGDILSFFGIRFPIHSTRFRSMTEDYPVPMEKTFQVLGEPKINLEDGIKRTVLWLKEMGFAKQVYV